MRAKKAMLDDLIDFVLAVFFLIIAIVLVLLVSNSGNQNQTIKIDEAMQALRAAETADHYFQTQRQEGTLDRFQEPETNEDEITTSLKEYFTAAYDTKWRIDLYNNKEEDPLLTIKNSRIITQTKSTYYLPLVASYLFINTYTGEKLGDTAVAVEDIDTYTYGRTK